MAKCCVCKREISSLDREEILESFHWIFAQADALGIESLQEMEQMILEGRIHSGCIEKHPDVYQIFG